MKKVICFVGISCLASGVMAEGLLRGFDSADQFRIGRIDAVRACFIEAQTVTDAKDCVGVSVPQCSAQAEDADAALCLAREARTWHAMAMMTAMNVAEGAPLPEGATRESFVGKVMRDMRGWTEATRESCGAEPVEVQPESWGNAGCWSRAAAQRAFTLLKTEDL